MKIKLKVARMEQRSILRADGKTADLITFVKLTPVDLPTGDCLLGFLDAEVVYHPEERLKDRDGVPTKISVPANTLIESAAVVFGGEAMTFRQNATVEFEVT